MKSFGAILLLLLFLTIHVGHIGYYWYGLKQIDQYWLEETELNYELKEVTIKINLPYWNTEEEYKPTHGALEIDGKKYRKVMQKYDSEGLHVLLAEDFPTERLNRTIADWMQMTTDTESSRSGSSSKLIKSLIKEYTPTGSVYLDNCLQEIASSINPKYCQFSLSDGYQSIVTPPPQG